MHTRSLQLFVAFPLLLATCCAGCGARTAAKTYAVSSGGTTWTVVTADPIPGIDHGVVSVITLKAGSVNSVNVVIWSDIEGGQQSSGSSSIGGAEDKGTHRGKGKRVDYSCSMANGERTTVRIEDTIFDPAKGHFFLVSTQGNRIEVKQMDLGVVDFPSDADAIRAFAASHSEVAEFFTKAKRATSESPSPKP